MITKRVPVRYDNEVILRVISFNANDDLHMKFYHIVKRKDPFYIISQSIQERLLNKRDQEFNFMTMILFGKKVDMFETPELLNVVDESRIYVYCKYLIHLSEDEDGC